ncbi:MAG: putative KHG/KDPG aldolase [Promethearchaeota archaeon]|nr:MAG: putative KHG/KDPG aldolase [Candidatus Lokiarchaeota archaeon]
MEIYQKISLLKLVPVVAIEDAEKAIPLALTLLNSNLPILEITFRTSEAAKSISLIREEFPELIIGAGTILTIEHVKSALNAGSMFMVSPGFNPTVVDYCIENQIPVIPGINSPTFIEWGLEKGLTHFKFFPAEVSGGPKMLKTFLGPYPQAKFLPTGGINNQNLIKYLELDNVFACGGSWLVKKELISAHKFNEVEKGIDKALKLIRP